MKLHSTISGQGEAVLLLHGLFGESTNLQKLARHLADFYQVHSLDTRNHGRSPFSEVMDYSSMALDVVDYMHAHTLASAHFIGHSMGGKTAMTLALNYPAYVNRLVVADIAPVSYPPHHEMIIKGLCAIKPDTLSSRNEADALLAEYVHPLSVRQFLLKNLYRQQNGGFAWRFNLNTIIHCYDNILAAPPVGEAFEEPMLFIAGTESDYIVPEYKDKIRVLFPKASLKKMPGASHWLHAEQADLFNRLCLNFLQSEH